MFWKTSLPLLIILIDSDTHIISETIKVTVFILISTLALSYWVNKISREYLKMQNITWQEYLKESYQILIEGFFKK